MASKVCDGCNPSAKTPASVPYAAFESSMSRAERIIKRKSNFLSTYDARNTPLGFIAEGVIFFYN